MFKAFEVTVVAQAADANGPGWFVDEVKAVPRRSRPSTRIASYLSPSKDLLYVPKDEPLNTTILQHQVFHFATVWQQRRA